MLRDSSIGKKFRELEDVATQDDTAFVYDDASRQVTKEITKLSQRYNYDRESKLTSVTDGQVNQVLEYYYDIILDDWALPAKITNSKYVRRGFVL